MIIGIDGNEANVTNRVGIGEYAFELLREFAKGTVLGEKNLFRVYLKDTPKDFLPRKTKELEYMIFGPRKLWTQFALPFRLFLEKEKPAVFFSPSHYAPRFSPIPTAISIMDVSYLKYPELFRKSDLLQLQKWTAYSAKKASAIFTISESSKRDIIDEYDIAPEKVHVTYPGIKLKSGLSPRIYTMNTLQSSFGIHGKYILFVGTLQPRKNIARLIQAFAILTKEYTDISLVIVGKKGWLFEEILAAPEKYDVKEKVKFLDFVSDDDLPLLYKHAVCYVLPSLYEGFGLPVLEAMKYDCPVITSNVSSLPEAGGDAALYIDPLNVQDIAATIKKLLASEKLRHELIEKGRKQIQKFSWEKTAKETLAVLQKIAK